jgi:hypothetical protein
MTSRDLHNEFGESKLMSVTQPSPLYRLIESKLDEPLTDFVARHRALVPREVPALSWREIAEEIERRTGEQVTGERVRQWFADADAPASTPSAAA